MYTIDSPSKTLARKVKEIPNIAPPKSVYTHTETNNCWRMTQYPRIRDFLLYCALVSCQKKYPRKKDIIFTLLTLLPPRNGVEELVLVGRIDRFGVKVGGVVNRVSADGSRMMVTVSHYSSPLRWGGVVRVFRAVAVARCRRGGVAVVGWRQGRRTCADKQVDYIRHKS